MGSVRTLCVISRELRLRGAAVCSVPADQLTKSLAAFVFIANYTLLVTHFAALLSLSQGGRNWLYFIFCISVMRGFRIRTLRTYL